MTKLMINDLNRTRELDEKAMEAIAGRGFWSAMRSLGRQLAYIGCNTLATVTRGSWPSYRQCDRHYGPRYSRTRRRRDFRRQR